MKKKTHKPNTVIWPVDLYDWITAKAEAEGRKFGPQAVFMLKAQKEESERNTNK